MMVRMCSARSSWSVVRQRSTEVARGTDQRSRSAAPRKCVIEQQRQRVQRAPDTRPGHRIYQHPLRKGRSNTQSHFGELDSSQDSSCRPPMRRSAAGALQRSASVLFAEARARPRDRPRQPPPASCARQSSSSAVRSRARRRRRAFNGSHQCRTRSVVRQD